MADLRISGITPHVAQNTCRSCGLAIDGRTARREGYVQSINFRKRIEQVSGWVKQASVLWLLKARARSKVEAVIRLHVVAYNLIRITNLLRARETLALFHRTGAKSNENQSQDSASDCGKHPLIRLSAGQPD